MQDRGNWGTCISNTWKTFEESCKLEKINLKLRVSGISSKKLSMNTICTILF